DPSRQEELADALFAASRHWGVSLHFNKGLAGAPLEAIEAALNTATNAAMTDAFALAIAGAEGPPAWPDIAGHEPDIDKARSDRAALQAAMAAIDRLVPRPASYVAESDYFL